jgi:hypothetical protein
MFVALVNEFPLGHDGSNGPANPFAPSSTLISSPSSPSQFLSRFPEDLQVPYRDEIETKLHGYWQNTQIAEQVKTERITGTILPKLGIMRSNYEWKKIHGRQ